jgi:hypothetical protein
MREHSASQIAAGAVEYVGLPLAAAFSTVMATIGSEQGRTIWSV